MKIHHASVILALGFFLAPSTAQAQPEFLKDNVTKIVRKVGVHVNYSLREPFDTDVSHKNKIGASVVLGGSRGEGWQFPVALTSFNENLHGPTGDQFATLNSWAIVGGVGYGWNFGKLSTGWDLETGVAFNSAKLQGTASQAFATSGPVSINVGNSLILRPRVKAEYFITRKFTVRATSDYMLTRPNITVTSAAGQVSDRWDPSHFHASFGIGFYPFRK